MVADLPVYPVALRLSGLKCLIVGGGKLAERKASSLHRAGATITVVAPEIRPELVAIAAEVHQRAFAPGDVAGHQLIFAATGIAAIDDGVAAVARDAGILVNAADRRSASSIILPAIFEQGPVTVAVSTNGKSPTLASYLRDEIATQLGSDVAILADVLPPIRAALHEEGRSSEGRDWPGLILAVLEAHRIGDDTAAHAAGKAFSDSWFGDNN